MVFDHARKETVKTAQTIKEMAQEDDSLEHFDTTLHPKYNFYRRDIGMSKNKEMKELFDYGFGIHHAGMLRSDRNMIEKMFEDNCIKVSTMISLCLALADRWYRYSVVLPRSHGV
jgi:antiviral helicase SLH1